MPVWPPGCKLLIVISWVFWWGVCRMMLGVTHSCIVPGKAINSIGFQLGDLRINTDFSKIWFLNEGLLWILWKTLVTQGMIPPIKSCLKILGARGKKLLLACLMVRVLGVWSAVRNVTIHHLVPLTLTSWNVSNVVSWDMLLWTVGLRSPPMVSHFLLRVLERVLKRVKRVVVLEGF